VAPGVAPRPAYYPIAPFGNATVDDWGHASERSGSSGRADGRAPGHRPDQTATSAAPASRTAAS